MYAWPMFHGSGPYSFWENDLNANTQHKIYKVMLYICTKFHENISKGVRVTELTQFLISKFSKRHRSIENLGGGMILVLNTFSEYALYLYKVSWKYLTGFQSYGETWFPIFKIFKEAQFCKKCRKKHDLCSLHIFKSCFIFVQRFMKISKRVSELLSRHDFQYSNFQRGIIP